ncbi:MAG: hypothetical protein ACFFD8_08830 [Candidatus Thorarchaeota archaeon]
MRDQVNAIVGRRRIGGDETILAVGQIRPTGSDMDAFDVWIASFTTAGELLWNRTIPIEEQAENPTTVFENGADQILVVGNWETWEEQYHKGFFSMCIDVNGSLVWDQFYEGEVCLRVVPCNDGGFLMLEIEHFWYWIEGYWVNRFNATGHLLWHRAYDLGYNVIEAFLLKSLSGSSILIGKKEVYESGEYLTEIYGSEFNEAGEVVMKIQIRLPHYQIYLHEMVVCSDGSLMGLGWDARKMACFAFCLKPSFRPTPPLLFSLNLFNPSSAMLVWMPSLDQDGIIDHYHLQLSPYANFSFINSSFDIEGHQWFKANLSSGIGYYRICGIDNLWVMSNWSNIVQVNIASQNRVLTLLSWVTIDVIATVVITISILFVVQKSKRWNPRPLNQEK